MKKNLFALLLVAAMVLGLFAGCGSTAASEAAASEPAEESTVAEAPAEEVAETEEAEVVETSAEEPAAEEAPAAAEDTYAFPGAELSLLDFSNEYTLPLSEDGAELTLVRSAVNLMGELANIGITTYDDFEYVQYLEELTGVHINFQELDFFTFSEQVNLIIASGDYPDIFQELSTVYATGLSGAVEDEVILDLTDMLAENAPNYNYMINSNPDYTKSFLNDGRVLEFMTPYDSVVNNQGLVIRQDWLDEVGMEVPETYSQLTDALYAFKDTFGASTAMYMNKNCMLVSLAEGYNIATYTVGGTTELPFYQDNGTVKCTLIEEDYRNYLTMLNEWYENGLIDSDFVSLEYDPFSSYLDGQISSDQMGVWLTSGEGIDKYECEVSCLAPLVQNEGDMEHITELDVTVDTIGAAISTTCEDPELAMAWLDYWYSEDGILLYNYGILDTDYTVDENNAPQWSEAIVNNEFAMTVSNYARCRCAYGNLSGVLLRYRTAEFNSELVNSCWETWKSNLDSTMCIPSYVSMTTEQSEECSYYATDILTYADQMIAKFVIGNASLESDWDAYVENMKSMGIETCIELEQAAYDAAMAG